LRSRNPPTSFAADVSAEFTYAHRCSDRAIRFLEEYARESVLLVVSYDEPHGPSICPPPYSEMHRGCSWPGGWGPGEPLEGKPEHQQVWAQSAPVSVERLQREAALFFGAQSFVDAEIGRVLEAAGSHAPGALLIYTSDHGDALGAHRLWGKGPAAYDEIARVPLVMAWAGRADPGQVWAEVASHIDLAPTILDALGCPVPATMVGTSIVRSLQGEGRSLTAPAFIEFGRYEVDHDGFGGFQPMRAVTDGHYKLVVNLLSSDELYDLDADPAEVTNLIEDPEHVEVRDYYHDVLLKWMHDTRDPFRGYQWERRRWWATAAPASWAGRGMTRQREGDGFEPRQLDYDTGLEMATAVRPKSQASYRQVGTDDTGKWSN